MKPYIVMEPGKGFIEVDNWRTQDHPDGTHIYVRRTRVWYMVRWNRNSSVPINVGDVPNWCRITLMLISQGES